MPSEFDGTTTPERRSRMEWLYSQGLGILCGQATVLLLAVGSVVLTATREGASSGIGMDDLRGFVSPPSPVHLWLYLLVPVLGLYALNTLLATYRSVLTKWRAGLRAPRVYAPAIIHIAFLVALLAHAVGGLAGFERQPVVLGPSWQALNDGREARLTALEIPRLPDGGVEQMWATVEVRDSAGAVSQEIVSYNGPLSSGLGSDLYILARATSTGVVQLAREDRRCEAEVGRDCALGELRVLPLYVHPPSSANQPTMARVRLPAMAGASAGDFWLAADRPLRLADGSWLALNGAAARPAVLLRARHAPGNPWALLSAVLLTLGVAMMWRRFV